MHASHNEGSPAYHSGHFTDSDPKGLSNQIPEAHPEPPKQSPTASWIEKVLSPESLKRLMLCGGGLMILGFVIWLWTIGIFENPLVAALGVGGINLAILGTGMSLVQWTRYQLAGRGLTLLAALAMPLNIWFYDAQGLIVLDEGGQLWIPAAACCVIYAGIARLLRDSAFVYTFVSGIVMTGMLFLADTHVNQFWQLLPQATFLSVIGWACMLSQFLFAKGEGEFSQQSFGKAFYRAGSLVLLGGLGLIAGGQLTIFLPEWLWSGALPEITSVSTAKWWGLSLIAGSAVTLGVRGLANRNRSEISLATFCGLWAGLSVLNILHLIPNLTELSILAAMILTAESLWTFYQSRIQQSENNESTNITLAFFTLASLSVFTAVQFILMYGLIPHWSINPNWFIAAPGWTGVALALSVCCAAYALGFRISDQSNSPDYRALSHVIFATAGGLLTIAVWSECFLLEVASLPSLLVMTFAIAAIYGVTNLFTDRGFLRSTTETVAGWNLLFSLTLFSLNTPDLFQQHAVHAAILGTAAILAGMLSRSSRMNLVVTCLTSAAAVLQLVLSAGLDVGLALCTIPTVIGTVLILTDNWNSNRQQGTPPHLANLGYTAIIIGSVAGVLMTLNRFVNTGVDGILLGTLISQLVVTCTFGFLAKTEEWRLGLRATSIVTALATMAVINDLSVLDLTHRIELLTLFSSLGLLVLGHATWAREGERTDGIATVCLLFGSLLMITPLGIGLVSERVSGTNLLHSWRLFHEITALSAGMILLGGGIVCRIRWTTFGGAILMAIYVVSLLTLIRWPAQLQNLSIAMMAGGGVFFGSAILLSIYRDRIMELPQKVKEGKGVFQVMNWR